MIQLPPGFDYTQLVNDFLALVAPFVGIVGLFAAYRLIRKASGHM